MKRTFLAVLASGLVALVTGVPAWAHHSFAAAYDTTNAITVHGVISQVLLRNPHSWFVIDVKDASGKVEQWSFEAGTPSGMIRNGYKPDIIKQGAEVTIKGSAPGMPRRIGACCGSSPPRMGKRTVCSGPRRDRASETLDPDRGGDNRAGMVHGGDDAPGGAVGTGFGNRKGTAHRRRSSGLIRRLVAWC
jgi:hypothetical protein